MKKLLVIAVVLIQIVTLVRVGAHFASASGFTQCSDGMNNDPAQDSLIDAADPGCHSDFNASNSSSYDSNLNSEINPTTGGGSGFTQCSDDINNDPLQDSLIDAADPGCHSDFNASRSSTYDPNLNSEINPTTSGGTTSYQCNDGSDNDNDGHIDMADPDCTGSTDNSEFSSCLNGGCNNPPCGSDCDPLPLPVYECSDNLDNDSDGMIDYPADPGCFGLSDSDEYNATASGGGITNSNTNTNTNSNSNTSSNNNSNTNTIIINGGGSGGGSASPQCDDNRDNDGDGDIDYPEDSGCLSYSDNTERSSASDQYECNDNRDNDSDGDIDYPEDSGCSSRTDDSERSGTTSRYQCDDNRDNDNDGDTDYPEDAGCSSRTDDSERSGGNNNSEPYFVSTPVNAAITGQLYSYDANAVSPDDRSLTYSLAVHPNGMTINSSNGLIQWSVPSYVGNTYQGALVVATDSDGNQATQSYIISVRGQVASAVTTVYQSTGGSGTARTSVSAPAQKVRITNLEMRDVAGDVIVLFRTNVDATGSVRFGPESEIEKTGDFTYPVSRSSVSGQGTFHEVNLGSLAPNRMYYLRAFALAPASSAFSPELIYVRTRGTTGASTATAEVAGADTCFDGLDNDRDGATDAADSDCEAGPVGRVAGVATFASTLESFGALLASPWFLLFVIAILVVYIIVRRFRYRRIEGINGPIEITS